MAGVDCDIHNKTAWPIQCPPNTPVVNGNGNTCAMDFCLEQCLLVSI